MPHHKPPGLRPDSAEYVQRAIPGLKRVTRVTCGAQALVFRADDWEGRRVAIKLPSAAQTNRAELASRLRLETDLLRRLGHDRILRVLRDGVLPDQRPYMISPWLEGRTLEDEKLTIKRETLLNVLDDVLDAVAHAHRKRIKRRVGVVHHDLRPGNIMVTPSGRGVVLDFGAAKPLGYLSREHHTEVGQWFGQSGYIAPEVMERGASVVKPSADVYSLGTILYSFRVQLEDQGKPGQFQVLLDHCRAEREAYRYRDAAELRAAFRAWRAHQTVPLPVRRVSLDARIKRLQAAALLLTTVAVYSFSGAADSTLDWDAFAFKSAARAVSPPRLELVREHLERVQAERLRGHEIAPNIRSQNVRAAHAVVREALKDEPSVLGGVALPRLIDAHFALVRVDALYHYSEPTPIGDSLPEVDRRRGGDPAFSQAYWFPAEASDRVRVIRRDRNMAIGEILKSSDADESVKLGFELFTLLQDARMPQDEGPGFRPRRRVWPRRHSVLRPLRRAAAPADGQESRGSGAAAQRGAQAGVGCSPGRRGDARPAPAPARALR